MSIFDQINYLPIVISGHTFKPNADGLWCLNDIYKSLRLPEAKRPSEWNNSVSAELTASGNFRKIDKVGSFADEVGTVAYAMWVSTAFYLMVARAFVAIRNTALRELIQKDELLKANMPKAAVLDRKAQGAGLTWSEACRIAGITHPRLALDALVSMNIFVFAVDNFGSRVGSPRPPKKGFEVGAFVKVSTDFGNREGWRVKQRGLDWMYRNTETINLKVAEMKAYNAKARRSTNTKPKR